MRTAAEPAPTIVVTRRIPDPADEVLSRYGRVEYLEDSGVALQERIGRGDPIVVLCQLTDRLTGDLLSAGNVVGVSNYAAGLDNIDLDAARGARVRIGHTPDVLTAPTADVAMLLILATARRAIEGDALMRRHEFSGWSPELLLGSSVSGATLGIVGAGRIAEATARRAVGFDMEVVYTRLRGAFSEPEPPIAASAREVGWDELLEISDFVSLHVPLAPETRHLIDAAALRRMRDSAILVNTARGPIVDEAALVDALRSGGIAGAGLDVYEDEPRTADGLTSLDSVVLLPHLGSATRETRAEMARICAENAVAFASGEPAPAEYEGAS